MPRSRRRDGVIIKQTKPIKMTRYGAPLGAGPKGLITRLSDEIFRQVQWHTRPKIRPVVSGRTYRRHLQRYHVFLVPAVKDTRDKGSGYLVCEIPSEE